MALAANMGLHEYIIIRVTPDQKNYTAWVADPTLQPGIAPFLNEPLNSTRTTSASTMGTNIQNALPTLGT